MEDQSSKESSKDSTDVEASDIEPLETTSVDIQNHKNGNILGRFLGAFSNRIFKKRNKALLAESVSRLVDGPAADGLITSEERKMIKNIIHIGDVKVNDVMIPRTDIVAIKENSNLLNIKKLIIAKEHTRMPIFRENLDDIVGFIHSKDLVKFLNSETGNFKIKDIIRKILYVPHSMRIIDLLLKMRSSRVHIAIVLDEYGGTDGLLTIEDIVEEIVGEIEDEHDLPDKNIYMSIKKINNKTFHVGGRVEIEKVEEVLNSRIVGLENMVDFDTIGGFILATIKKVPDIGETFKCQSLTFKVLDADMRSIKLVEIVKSK